MTWQVDTKNTINLNVRAEAMCVWQPNGGSYACRSAVTTVERMMVMSRRGFMSDELKDRLAEELGFADTVRQHGWGSITTRDAGNLVKLAIAKAEQMMQERQ